MARRLPGSPRRVVVFQGTFKVLFDMSELNCSSFLRILSCATAMASAISSYDVKLSAFQVFKSMCSMNATVAVALFLALYSN